MKRLTYRQKDQNDKPTENVMYNSESFDWQNFFTERECEQIALRKLADYEDTGLEPDEFKSYVEHVFALESCLRLFDFIIGQCELPPEDSGIVPFDDCQSQARFLRISSKHILFYIQEMLGIHNE